MSLDSATKVLDKETFSFDDVLIQPQHSYIYSRDDVDISTTVVGDLGIQIPVISANMDTVTEKDMAVAMAKNGAVGVIHRFMDIDEQSRQIKEVTSKGYRIVGGSLGVGDNFTYKVNRLIASGARFMVIDVAHGDHQRVLDVVSTLKQLSPSCLLIVGNIATKEAANRLINAGADGLKVGIGPGSFCTTRKQTGVGVPQITAIQDVSSVARPCGVTVCADGGLRHVGDIAKAIAAGADTVMSGRMFAGCDESPGRVFLGEKEYRGSASFSCKVENGKDGRYVEGDSGWVPRTGPVKEKLDEISDGLRSACSYVGASNLEEFRENAIFIRSTEGSRNI